MKENKKKIAVLGGSFNPPTSAHYKLMKETIDAINAEIGFFAPVSDAYLKRKMSHSHPPVVLPSELRINMLHAMCCEDYRMQVYDKNMYSIEARTMPTLMAIQDEYPDAELYFIMGADKLDLLTHLAGKKAFLDAFKVILYSREDEAFEQTLKSNEVLSNYQSRIIILPQPEGTDTISSSAVRECMLRVESSQNLLCPGVWELYKKVTSADFPDVINKFKDDYAFLDNRFDCKFVWQGLQYSSAEAAFQASKCASEADRKVYTRCSVQKAILKGKEQTPYPGWEEAHLDIMESIIQAKFEQNDTLMKKLIDTGNSILINGNNKQETYWGVDLYSWTGENQLGKIIMNIRKKETLK